MSSKRKAVGSITAFVGYMLSPLSWWNDLFVNVPLALAFAWVVSLFWKGGFLASAVVGYWLTNVIGFILLHKGIEQVLSKKSRRYARIDLVKDVVVSLLYTMLIVALVHWGVLKPVQSYFPKI